MIRCHIHTAREGKVFTNALRLMRVQNVLDFLRNTELDINEIEEVQNITTSQLLNYFKKENESDGL